MKDFLLFINVLMVFMSQESHVKTNIVVPNVVTQIEQPISTEAIGDEINLPNSLNIDLPFFAQAPLGNWDLPWQESCEEASILLIENYYHKRTWDKYAFNAEILKLVEWQKRKFGDYINTSLEQNKIMLSELFGLNSVIVENPSLDQIKTELVRGNLIIMPFAGKLLYNPYFLNGGPYYHVFLIKGYTESNELIADDVGTTFGNNYIYSWETIKTALHDLYEPIESGPKRMLVVHPPSL